MCGRPTRPGGCQAQKRTVPGARKDCPRRGAPGRARSGLRTAPRPGWARPVQTGATPAVPWERAREASRPASAAGPGPASGRARPGHRSGTWTEPTRSGPEPEAPWSPKREGSRPPSAAGLGLPRGRAQHWLLRCPAGESRAPWEPDRGTGDCRSLLFFLLSGCPGARGDGLRDVVLLLGDGG